MFDFLSLEFLRQANNIIIIALGALAIIFVLRGVFKVAWRVIKLVLIFLGILMVVGYLTGWLNISIS
ncbi:MAG: hypothetical protein AB2L21_03970 [Anaerolineaceae bacterium]|jgi:hypothetical protein